MSPSATGWPSKLVISGVFVPKPLSFTSTPKAKVDGAAAAADEVIPLLPPQTEVPLFRPWAIWLVTLARLPPCTTRSLLDMSNLPSQFPAEPPSDRLSSCNRFGVLPLCEATVAVDEVVRDSVLAKVELGIARLAPAPNVTTD